MSLDLLKLGTIVLGYFGDWLDLWSLRQTSGSLFMNKCPGIFYSIINWISSQEKQSIPTIEYKLWILLTILSLFSRKASFLAWSTTKNARAK